MRPDNWDEINPKPIGTSRGCAFNRGDMYKHGEACADAYAEGLKGKGLYGEYGEDFIVSSRVKVEDMDWAEAFFETLDGKGWLVFIPEEIQ